MPIDWSLAKPKEQPLEMMLKGYEQGRKARREEASRNALNALLMGGENPSQTPGIGDGIPGNTRMDGATVPYADLTPEDMRTALLIQGAQREEAKARRESDFNRAAYDFTTGNNALLSLGGQNAPANALSSNAVLPETMQVPGTFAPTLPDQPRPTVPQNPAFAQLGEPRSNADRAFLKMLEIDPAKAMKFKGELRDNFVKMLGQERDVYAAAVDRLAYATDEASYQRTIAELGPMLASINGDISKIAPPNYPGPEGIRDLTMRAMGAKDRISALISQDRADTYARDVEADNARQDRNTESLITDRNERRSDQRRYNEARVGVARDRANTYRENSNRPSGGGRSSGGGRAAAPVKVNTPAEAMKLPKGTRYTTPDGKVMVR